MSSSRWGLPGDGFPQSGGQRYLVLRCVWPAIAEHVFLLAGINAPPATRPTHSLLWFVIDEPTAPLTPCVPTTNEPDPQRRSGSFPAAPVWLYHSPQSMTVEVSTIIETGSGSYCVVDILDRSTNDCANIGDLSPAGGDWTPVSLPVTKSDLTIYLENENGNEILLRVISIGGSRQVGSCKKKRGYLAQWVCLFVAGLVSMVRTRRFLSITGDATRSRIPIEAHSRRSSTRSNWR